MFSYRYLGIPRFNRNPVTAIDSNASNPKIATSVALSSLCRAPPMKKTAVQIPKNTVHPPESETHGLGLFNRLGPPLQ